LLRLPFFHIYIASVAPLVTGGAWEAAVASRNTRSDDMFYVFNRAGDAGYHEIKNEKGEVIADAYDTEEQARGTLEALGLPSDDLEIVYDQAQWDNIGLEYR